MRDRAKRRRELQRDDRAQKPAGSAAGANKTEQTLTHGHSEQAEHADSDEKHTRHDDWRDVER
jgi:hypothetical protein